MAGPELAAEAFGLILRERADTLQRVVRRELRAWLESIRRDLASARDEGAWLRSGSAPEHG